MSTAEKIAKKLAKDVSKTKAYDNGTIIAWTSHSSLNGVDYSYAAVFANGLWYTTVARDNRYLSKTMTNDELMEYFGSMDGVEDIRVASEFIEVDL